jgi:hypothetical protein
MAPSSNATIYWWLKATDVAGNVGVSDRQPTVSGFADPCDSDAFVAFGSTLAGKNIVSPAAVAGCQPFAVLADFSAPG